MESQAWFADRKQGRCPGCGQRLRDTTAPDAEDRKTTELVRCHHCRAQYYAMRGVDGDDRAGLLVHVYDDEEV